MRQEINLYIKYALIILLTYLSFLIIKPYLTVIILSIILAYMCFPLQKFFRSRIKKESIVAGILTIVLFLIIVIPLIILANSLLNELANIYATTNIDTIKELINSKFGIGIGENTQNIANGIAKNGAAYLLTKISDFIFSIPNLLISFFIMFCIVFFGLRDGEKILERTLQTIPIEESYKKRFQKKFTSSIESLFYGNLAIAILEAVVAMFGFYLLGIKAPILWGSVIGLTALIPGIGATAVWIPMALISYLQGNTSKAILIALFGFIILSALIDTIIRAKVMGMRAQIHPLIIIIGVLGGLAAFGFIGLLIGPLILSLFELIIDIYLETKDAT